MNIDFVESLKFVFPLIKMITNGLLISVRAYKERYPVLKTWVGKPFLDWVKL